MIVLTYQLEHGEYILSSVSCYVDSLILGMNILQVFGIIILAAASGAGIHVRSSMSTDSYKDADKK